MSDVEDASHLGQHERVLLHVRAAQTLGDAGRARLRADELVGRLRAVAHRQLGVRVELAGLADALRSARAIGISRSASRARWALRMSR